MKTAAIYARISKADKTVPKTEQQIAQCQALAEANGYEVIKVYEDDGLSAFKEDVERPGYEALLEDTRAGLFELILAVEESRFTRQGVGEKERLMMACTLGGVRWHTTREGEVDPSSDEGEFMSSIRALMDKQELKKKTRRQKDRYAEERAKGNPLWGGRPFGYESDRKTLKADEAEAIRHGISMVVDDHASVFSVRAYLNDVVKLRTPRGNRWSGTTTKELLTRPRNAGIYIQDGKTLDVEPTWETIISRERYDALIAELNSRHKESPGRKPKYVGNMLIHCGVCGEKMKTASDGKGIAIFRCRSKTYDSHPGYSEERRHVSIRVQYVESAVREEIINAFFFGSEILSTSTSEGQDLVTLQKKIMSTSKKKAELIALASDPDSGVSAADIAPGVKELSNTLNALEANLSALKAEKAHAAMLDEIRRSMSLADAVTHRINDDAVLTIRKALTDKYDSLSLDTKRTLLQDLLEVTIAPAGRGAKKVKIHHKVVTHLNDQEEYAEVN